MNQKSQINDISIIILLWRMLQADKLHGNQFTLSSLFNAEKLFHMTVNALNKHHLKAAPFDLSNQINSFIQNINKLTMEKFSKSQDQTIDVLMLPNLSKFIKPRLIGQLKVLTFNNLACIYKRKKNYNNALKIEQKLVRKGQLDQKYSIITTYLNKAAILSQLKKHDRSLQQILKASKTIKGIEQQLDKLQENEQQRNDDQGQQNKQSKFKQKRYYALYMKMIVHYNIGVEYEHLARVQSAVKYYKRGKKLATQLNNQMMKNKFQSILEKLKK